MDPNLGRFITEDPIKDGSNYYIYCQNNPLTRIDPTGLSWENNVPEEYREDVVARSGDEKAQERMKSASEYSDDDDDDDNDKEDPVPTEEDLLRDVVDENESNILLDIVNFFWGFDETETVYAGLNATITNPYTIYMQYTTAKYICLFKLI